MDGPRKNIFIEEFGDKKKPQKKAASTNGIEQTPTQSSGNIFIDEFSVKKKDNGQSLEPSLTPAKLGAVGAKVFGSDGQSTETKPTLDPDFDFFPKRTTKDAAQKLIELAQKQDAENALLSKSPTVFGNQPDAISQQMATQKARAVEAGDPDAIIDVINTEKGKVEREIKALRLQKGRVTTGGASEEELARLEAARKEKQALLKDGVKALESIYDLKWKTSPVKTDEAKGVLGNELRQKLAAIDPFIYTDDKKQIDASRGFTDQQGKVDLDVDLDKVEGFLNTAKNLPVPKGLLQKRLQTYKTYQQENDFANRAAMNDAIASNAVERIEEITKGKIPDDLSDEERSEATGLIDVVNNYKKNQTELLNRYPQVKKSYEQNQVSEKFAEVVRDAREGKMGFAQKITSERNLLSPNRLDEEWEIKAVAEKTGLSEDQVREYAAEAKVPSFLGISTRSIGNTLKDLEQGVNRLTMGKREADVANREISETQYRAPEAFKLRVGGDDPNVNFDAILGTVFDVGPQALTFGLEGFVLKQALNLTGKLATGTVRGLFKGKDLRAFQAAERFLPANQFARLMVKTGVAETEAAGLAKIGAAVDKAKSVAAVYIPGKVTSYEGAYQEAARFTNDEGKRKEYARQVSDANAISELIFNDADFAAKILKKVPSQEVFQRYLNEAIPFGTKDILKAKMARFAQIIGYESAEELWPVFKEAMAKDEIFDYQTSATELFNQSLNTVVTTAIGTTPMGLLGSSRLPTSQLVKASLFEAGFQPEKFKAEFDGKFDRGEIGEAERNRANQKINQLAKIVSGIPNTNAIGRTLTQEEKNDIAYKELQSAGLTMAAEKSSEGLKKHYESEVKESQKAVDEIMTSEVPIPAKMSVARETDKKAVELPQTDDQWKERIGAAETEEEKEAIMLQHGDWLIEQGKKDETFLKDQSLSTPNNLIQRLGSEEAVVDVIAKNSPKDIKEALKTWAAKMSAAETELERDDAENHVALLEAGLEKNKAVTVESAAIEIGGKWYYGKNHAEAILDAKSKGADISGVDRQGQGKFKLSDGSIIDRAEAKSRFGQDRSEAGLIKQDADADQANKDYKKLTATTTPKSEPSTEPKPASTIPEQGGKKIIENEKNEPIETVIEEPAQVIEPIPSEESSTPKSQPDKNIEPTEEGTGEPPAPPTEEKKSLIYTERPPTELSFTGLQNVANEFSLPNVESRESKTDVQLRQDATNQANDWAEKGEYAKNIDRLVRKAEAGEILTDEERVIMERHLANVSAELRAIKDKSSDEWKTKFDEIKRLKAAGQATRSAAGAALRVPDGGSLPHPIEDYADANLAMAEASGVDDLTEQQKIEVEKLVDDFEKKDKIATEKIADLEAKLFALQAQKEIGNVAAEKKKAATKQRKTHEERVQERKDAVAKAREALAKLRSGESGLSAVPLPGIRELIAIAPHVKKVVESLVGEAIDNFKEIDFKKIISTAHDEFKEDGLREEDIRDIVAGRYSQKKPPRSELAKNMQDLKTEANLINKLEALLMGEEPKTEAKKIERNQKIKYLREQIKNVSGFESDLLKAADVALSEKEKQVKQLERELTQAEKVIDTAERKEELRKLDAAEKELKKEIREAERETKQLEREFEKEKRAEQRIALKAKVDEARELERQLKYKTPGEKRLAEVKKQNEEKAEKIKDKLASGNFAPEEKTTTIFNSPALKRAFPKEYNAALDAIAAREQAQLDFDIAVFKAEQGRRSKVKKGIDFGRALIATTKALKTGIDMSAIAIQNAVAIVSHPRSGLRAIKESLADTVSERRFRRYLTELHNSPIWDLIVKSGLNITDPKSLQEQNKEEVFDNNLLNKDIVIKGKRYNIGKYLTRPFERAFTSMGNAMRVNMFARITERWQEEGKTFESNPEDYKSLATLLNTETGRGTLHKQVQGASKLIGAGIWSPRLMASRLNMLGISDLTSPITGKGYYKGLTPKIRKMAAADFAKFVGAITAAKAFFGWRGAETDNNPESPTFCTIKIGNKSYNITGGHTTYVKAVAQAATGHTMKDGERVPVKREKVIFKFARGKLTPIAGVTTDVITGKDYSGKPISFGGELINLGAPISVTSAVEAVKKDGVMGLLTYGLPSFVGIGVSDQRDFTPKINTFKIYEKRGTNVREATEQEIKETKDKTEKYLEESIKEAEKNAGWGYNKYKELTIDDDAIKETGDYSKLSKEDKKELNSRLKKSATEKAQNEIPYKNQ